MLRFGITDFFLELTESTIKAATESENGSGSDKSDPIEIISFGDESSSSNKSEDDFDNNLPETVTLLKHEQTGAKVYLVGTAHFSKESQEDVAMVRQIKFVNNPEFVTVFFNLTELKNKKYVSICVFLIVSD